MQLIILLLCLAGILLTQTLIGGAKPIFGIPGYLLVAAAGTLAIFLPSRRIHAGVRLPAVITTLVMIGYIVVRSYTSPVEYLARPDRFMVLAAIVVYLLTAHYLTSPRQRQWILFGLLGLSLLHTVCGILQFARNDNFMLLSLVPAGAPIPEIFRGADYGWRASGFYVCPNHLAGLLETLAFLALARCCFSRTSAFGRVLALYFAVSALVGVALTGSRGGYISTAMGFAVFFGLSVWVIRSLDSSRTWITLGIIGAVAGFFVIAGVYYAMSQSAVIQGRLDQLADTKNMRLHMWAAALKQFQLAPIFGTGSGTYLYFGRQFRAASVQNDPQHVHNDYLELLCEYGVVGVVLFLVFFVVHLTYGFRTIATIIRRRLAPSKRVFSNELALLIGVIAAIGALVIHSIVDFNCHIPGNVLYFAFLFGVLACPTADQNMIEKPAPEGSRMMRFVLPATSIFLAVTAVPLLRPEYHDEWARVHLRNKLYYELIAKTQAFAGWATPFARVGLPLPATGAELVWLEQFWQNTLLPNAVRHADAGLATDAMNPDLYYYLGEARHFLALTASETADKRMMFAAAGDAYAEGLRVFPYDARLQMRLARAFDLVGLPKNAEELYAKALAADPNFANTYAMYGQHLWRGRKILRAEGYFARALQLDHTNLVARLGLVEISRIRSMARTPAFIDEVGDPLELFDLEPLTDEDEARGVTGRSVDQ